jgi:hypothetical protein
VGAGLLAKAVGQLALMLNVLALSRASSLPQGIWGESKSNGQPETNGGSLQK